MCRQRRGSALDTQRNSGLRPIAVFVTISVIFLGNSGESLFRDPDGPRIANPLPNLLEEEVGGERFALYRIKK